MTLVMIKQLIDDVKNDSYIPEAIVISSDDNKIIQEELKELWVKAGNQLNVEVRLGKLYGVEVVVDDTDSNAPYIRCRYQGGY